VDVVIDTVGKDIQDRSFAILKRGGTLISSVAPPDQTLAKSSAVNARFILVDVTSAVLTQLAALLDEGKLRTRVGPVLPLSEARSAHEMLEGVRQRPPGKIVLSVGNNADATS
jgi:NADPH:quinone reductase-like Zn-dependent oxidoreductase